MNMQRKKPGVDVIKDVLALALQGQPQSSFLISLSKQYEERGGLSKRQLQGLLGKAQKLGSIPDSKLATLEAEILKRPTRYKSERPEIKPLYEKDEAAGQLIEKILSKYPAHKRVLFFKLKYDRNELLSPAEMRELQQFAKLLS
jgi:hypothetical protein